MSIRINKEKCVSCGRCIDACPGNLLELAEGKADIRIPEDCWGCTSCMKYCSQSALEYYLGADLGGRGAVMTIEKEKDIYNWKIHMPGGETKVISVNRKNANQY